MEEGHKRLFSKVVSLGCRESVSVGRGLDSPLDELIQVGLARIADLHQMEGIQSDTAAGLFYLWPLEVDWCALRGRVVRWR
jgi:hypothetical protein